MATDRASLSKVASDQIRGQILDGRLKPGERLVEDKLSAELGVSRVPVREALRGLSMEGLVRLAPNRGATKTKKRIGRGVGSRTGKTAGKGTKGQKCRQTGIAAEIFNEMGMRTVNMPGGEIMPAAERGTIDCAEWVGGIEDLRFGFHTIWKWHYAPSLHESVSIGELLINGDVWKSLGPLDQEIVKAAITEQLFVWWAKWQRQNAEAVVEMRDKHKVFMGTTPEAFHKEFLEAWDKLVIKESATNPVFKEVADSLKKWASVTVPAKRFYYPAYSIAADHYWAPKK